MGPFSLAVGGRWEASTEYGDFAIIITPEGTAIQDVKYSFRCGDNSINDSNFRLTEPYPLDGRKLDFGVYLAGQVPMATWEAKFSRDGNTLSGTLELMAGGCSSDFEITR